MKTLRRIVPRGAARRLALPRAGMNCALALCSETIKLGATDYVLKQRVGRLVPAVRRALQEAEELSLRKESEAALHKAQIELKAHAENLEKTVAERTARLKATVAELESFSYTLSHDMRAHVRAITGYYDVVFSECRGELKPSTMELLRKINVAALRIDQLILDVLALSRVTRQDVALGPVDVEKLVRELVQSQPGLQPSSVQVEIVSPLLPMQGHPVSLAQCLTNLLSNAVKFVAPGTRPHVRIYSEDRKEQVRLWVVDNGIGIPGDAQASIFEMFHRLHRTDEYEGTGIGLAIVRKGVERMGGQLGLASEPGKGSQFWIELPRPEAH